MKTLKQLITESVNEYLREIEEAGNENAVIEKMTKCKEAIALRERKINKEGIEEAMHDMIDPKKIKELQKEVKVIEKTLKKYQKQLEKLKSKNKHVGTEDTEDSTEEPEEIIDENVEDMEGKGRTEDDPLMEVLTPEEEEELDRIEDIIRDKADYNRVSFNSRTQDRYKELKAKKEAKEPMNESFLYMQKLAGIITEAQYQVKKKVLNKKKSIAEGMENNLVVTYIENKDDYNEKGLADGFEKKEGKTVKYIVGYDENDDSHDIGYIYDKNNNIKSYTEDDLDNAFMNSLNESQYRAKKKVLNEETRRYFVVVNNKGQSDELGNMHGIEASDKNDFIQKFKSMFKDDISAPQQPYDFYEVSNEETMNKIVQMSDKWEGEKKDILSDKTKELKNIADKAKSFDKISF